MAEYENIRQKLKEHYANKNVSGMTWGLHGDHKAKRIVIHLKKGDDIEATGQLAVQLFGYVKYRSLSSNDFTTNV